MTRYECRWEASVADVTKGSKTVYYIDEKHNPIV